MPSYADVADQPEDVKEGRSSIFSEYNVDGYHKSRLWRGTGGHRQSTLFLLIFFEKSIGSRHTS